MSTGDTSRWRALGRLLRPDAGRWAGFGAVVALASSATLAGPVVVRHLVDRATAGTTTAEVVRLALLFLATAAVAQALSVVVTWLATTTAWGTTNALRLRLARHVLGLDHEFHRQHTPGELIQRVDGDVTAVSDFLGKVVPKAAGAGLTVVGIVAVLAAVDWRLALGAAVYTAASVAIVVRSRHRAVGESSDEMSAYARLYGGIEERLVAGEDLRANGASTHAMWRFVEESAATMGSSVRRERAFLQMWWMVQSSVAAGSALSLIAGALMVERGLITLGTAFLLFQYALLLTRPLEDVVDQLETVQKASGAMVRVVDLLDARSTIVDHGVSSPPPGSPEVHFDGVEFDYGDGHRVVAGIDLRVAAGRSIGLVGRTGSGKTTLARLALRLVEPTAGCVRLGGLDVRDIPLGELRRRVAMIPQEVELFAGSVRDNVTLFDPAPSDAAVARALRGVGLGALAADLDRHLDSGSGLSAGEAQLLALARVWLREPDVVVLDEATARVDPVTESRLEAALAELIRGRTTIVVAHRLSTLAHLDEIAVIDHGSVVEHGDRSRLTASEHSRFHHLLELAMADHEPQEAMG